MLEKYNRWLLHFEVRYLILYTLKMRHLSYPIVISHLFWHRMTLLVSMCR